MALWIRNLSHFGVNLEWHGGNKVLVTDKDNVVIDVAHTEGSDDPAIIGKLMGKMEEEMYEDATAMEK